MKPRSKTLHCQSREWHRGRQPQAACHQSETALLHYSLAFRFPAAEVLLG